MLRLTPALALPQVSKELETIIYLQTIKELHFINGRGNISQFLTLTRRGRHVITSRFPGNSEAGRGVGCWCGDAEMHRCSDCGGRGGAGLKVTQ